MPVRTEVIPPPSQSKQLGFPKTLLYNGSKFEGSQKSKGNSYAVEVVLQVNFFLRLSTRKCQVFAMIMQILEFIIVSACWRRKFISVWVFENYWSHVRVSNADDILWWWNYIKEISILNTKMGCWWRCR